MWLRFLGLNPPEIKKIDVKTVYKKILNSEKLIGEERAKKNGKHSLHQWAPAFVLTKEETLWLEVPVERVTKLLPPIST